jgi:tRNA pseudouridine38-40 synthase
VRIALGIEYDGAGFNGWQTQPDGRSVQDALESALSGLAGHRVATICAGRTDAGVHATGQVASFTTESRLTTAQWLRALNAHLPPTVAALTVREMAPDFHARFNALSRQYRYTILNRPVRSALERGRVWHVAASLDGPAMATALAELVGQHDFAAFAGASAELKAGASTTRTLLSATCRRDGDHVEFDLCANAFLPHMVRNIVGTLVLIGRGSLEPEAIGAILASRDRRRAGPTAPPDGLCLVRVNYGDPE